MTAPRRATRPAGPPRRALRADTTRAEPGICRCKPTPVAHYSNGELIALYRRHWGSIAGRAGCGLPNEPLNPHTYGQPERQP